MNICRCYRKDARKWLGTQTGPRWEETQLFHHVDGMKTVVRGIITIALRFHSVPAQAAKSTSGSCDDLTSTRAEIGKPQTVSAQPAPSQLKVMRRNQGGKQSAKKHAAGEGG